MVNKTKIYLAAPWAERKLAKEYADILKKEGFELTSRWIDKHLDKPVDQTGLEFDKDILIKEALEDVKDVGNADILLLLNTQKRGEETSGKAVELGLALAYLKPCLVVGEKSNIFHYLCPCFDNLQGAIDWIKAEQIKKQNRILVVPSSIIST